ncbi:MAG: SEC-C metal-binding domain-containing protein, partial [Gaiellaceae bacterium]
AQKDPLVEYTAEGERMFTALGRAIRAEVVLHLFHAELAGPEEGGAPPDLTPTSSSAPNGNLQYESEATATATIAGSPNDKLGRNDPCWCGSGKKFKKCHGA